MLNLTLRRKGRSNVLDPNRVWDMSVLAVAVAIASWCGFSRLVSPNITAWSLTHLSIAIVNKDPWIAPGFITSAILMALPEDFKQYALVAVIVHVALATTIMENPPFPRMASMILQLVSAKPIVTLLLSIVHYLRPSYASADFLRKAVLMTSHRLSLDNKLHTSLRHYADTVLARGSIRDMRNYLVTTREVLVNEDPQSDLINVIRSLESETQKDQVWFTASNVMTTLAVITAIPNAVALHSGTGGTNIQLNESNSAESRFAKYFHVPVQTPTSITNSQANQGDSYHTTIANNISDSKDLLMWVCDYFRDKPNAGFGDDKDLVHFVSSSVRTKELDPSSHSLRTELCEGLFQTARPIYDKQSSMAVAAFTAVLDKFVGISMFVCSVNEATNEDIPSDTSYAIRAPTVGRRIKDDVKSLNDSRADPNAPETILFRFIAEYLTLLADKLINKHVINPHRDVRILFLRLFGPIVSTFSAQYHPQALIAVDVLQRTSTTLDALVNAAAAKVTMSPDVALISATYK